MWAGSELVHVRRRVNGGAHHLTRKEQPLELSRPLNLSMELELEKP